MPPSDCSVSVIMTEIRPKELYLDSKWDTCVDLTLRRFVYSSLAAAAGGLLLLRKSESAQLRCASMRRNLKTETENQNE